MYIENGYVTMSVKEFNKMMKGDRLVTREKFLKKYKKELDKEDHGKLYGNDVTIHWNGMFCTCEDGATAYNHIICGLEDAMTELDDEERKERHMETKIVEYYSGNGDITFLMEETWDGEDPVESEIVGFYYGEPNEENTKYFAHRGVIAKYDYQKGAKPRTDVFYSRPLPIDDKQDRISQMVDKVNEAIADAYMRGSRETSFPFNGEDAFFKDVKKMFEDEGYNIFVNIYARCGGTHYTISW